MTNINELAEQGKKAARKLYSHSFGIEVDEDIDVLSDEAQAPLIAAIKEKDAEIKRLLKELYEACLFEVELNDLKEKTKYKYHSNQKYCFVDEHDKLMQRIAKLEKENRKLKQTESDGWREAMEEAEKTMEKEYGEYLDSIEKENKELKEKDKILIGEALRLKNENMKLKEAMSIVANKINNLKINGNFLPYEFTADILFVLEDSLRKSDGTSENPGRDIEGKDKTSDRKGEVRK